MFVAMVLVLAWGGAGCSRPPQAEAKAEAKAVREAEAEAKEEKASDLDRPLAEIFSDTVRCEHGIAQYTCATCRYELGVVKVAPGVLEGSGFRTAVAERGTLATGQEMTGEVRLDENRSTYIGPLIPGVVRAIRVDLGDRVRAGQVLFEIEATDLGETRAAHRRAHAATELAQATLRREEELFQKQICPEKDVLEARAALQQAEAAEEASHQRLAALGIADRDVDARDDRTRGGQRLPVRAPFDGMVLERALNLGALVAPGEKNLLIADTSTVWVNTTVRERELAAILERQHRAPVEATVVVPAFGSRTFKGRVAALAGLVDEATRTSAARVVVENPEGLLRPGMFAQVTLRLDTGEPVVAVPDDAVLEDGGRAFVFVRHDADYYVRRPVTTGRRGGGRVEIVRGLSGGETIVTSGSFLLKSDILRSKMGAGCAD